MPSMAHAGSRRYNRGYMYVCISSGLISGIDDDDADEGVESVHSGGGEASSYIACVLMMGVIVAAASPLAPPEIDGGYRGGVFRVAPPATMAGVVVIRRGVLWIADITDADPIDEPAAEEWSSRAFFGEAGLLPPLPR